MRRLATLAAIALVIAACGGEGATTSVSAPVPGDSPTTGESAGPAGDPQFALTHVGLGDSSMVVITNFGDGPGNLQGFALCQRPAYYGFESVQVMPGESVAIATTGNPVTPPEGVTLLEGVATIGELDPTSGEVGFYSERSFGNPDAIVSYVEWGEAGHGRSGTAVDAGIWVDGGFVETVDTSANLVATEVPALAPGDWEVS